MSVTSCFYANSDPGNLPAVVLEMARLYITTFTEDVLWIHRYRVPLKGPDHDGTAAITRAAI